MSGENKKTDNTVMYKLINKEDVGQWKTFFDTPIVIAQGENTVVLGKKELKQLERIIGCRFTR